ncbi:MAG: N-acetyltransferase [Cyanobium sp. M30B3]|nr:MAG: N-acetyltransferase [Cyanobium sp. M30B3]
MLPFRHLTPAPRLPAGYRLLSDGQPTPAALDALLLQAGDRPRGAERWQRVLERSLWHLRIETDAGQLVGFVRATSDRALNANLWDLWADLHDPLQEELMQALVQAALGRMRRELPGCSISLSAPPGAQAALERCGFLVDPNGIRAMGLALQPEHNA